MILSKKNENAIAAGFGPERLLRIIEKVNDIGDITTFKSLKSILGESVKICPLESAIVVDHVRGLVFLIKDGVTQIHGQKNRSRRYLMRKYFQNFKINLEKLPIKNKEEVLVKLIDETINLFAILFPEFNEKKEYISLEFLRLYNANT